MNKEILFGCDGLTFDKKTSLYYSDNKLPLAADIAIPCDCLNNCVYCGYYHTQQGLKLKTNEINDIIQQLAGLSIKSIRIVGEGEPLLRNDILELLAFMRELNIKPLIFSCGDVLGDDQLAKKRHGKTGQEIIDELKRLDVTVILKYEGQFQDDLVRREGYSNKRNQALERLFIAGFNKQNPTRLGFGTVIMKYNKDIIPEIYQYALQNNIFPLLCPLMPIGSLRNKEYRDSMKLTEQEMIDTTVKLHIIAFKLGIKYNGPSDFPGSIPCFIAKFGLYITDIGDIYPCVSEKKMGNIREMGLKHAWDILLDIKETVCKQEREEGKCYMKRKLGIIPKSYDEKVNAKILDYISCYPEDFNSLEKEKLFNSDWQYVVQPSIFEHVNTNEM